MAHRIRFVLMSVAACSAVVGATIVACSSFDAAGTAPTPDASPAQDALPPPDDGDAFAGDAFRADVDSGSGGGPDGAPCSAVHDFCDDFEGARTVQGAWNFSSVTGTGLLAIDAGVLVASYADDGGFPFAFLGYTAAWPAVDDAGTHRQAAIRFRARVMDCPGPADGVSPMTINVGPACGSQNAVSLVVYAPSPGACVAQVIASYCDDAGPTAGSRTASVPFNVATWHDVAVSIANGNVTLTLEDGVDHKTSTTPTPTSTIGVNLGAYPVGSPSASIELDDVVLDFTK